MKCVSVHGFGGLFAKLVLVLALIVMVPVCCAYQAFVVVPVSNVTGAPLSALSEEELAHKYQTMGCSWNTVKDEIPRIHQVLFNQRVEVTDIRDGLAKITVPNVFAINPKTSPLNPFSRQKFSGWMLAQDLVAVDDVLSQSIPSSIDAFNFVPSSKHIVALVSPWQNQLDGQIYSIGTRFMRDFNDTQDEFGVLWYDKNQKNFRRAVLARSLCYVQGCESFAQRRAHMVELANRLVDAKDTAIPYVWGGGSVGLPATGAPELRQDGGGWVWPSAVMPFMGSDCSYLVVLLSQVFELPYFCKNTTTLACYTAPIAINESVREGDIVWYRVGRIGHIMMVSNVERAEFIENQGYINGGAGRLRRGTLTQRFADAKTYAELLSRMRLGKTVGLMRKGNVVQEIKTLLIFSFQDACLGPDNVHKPSYWTLARSFLSNRN